MLARREGPPQWVLPGAKFDLDFANQRYWGGAVGIVPAFTSAFAPGLVLGGPGNGAPFPSYAPDNLGILRSFPQYCPRIAPGTGLWSNRGSTNYALWSRDFTNAVWAKTTMTANHNQIGADLVTSGASLLTATGANATVLQGITLTSTAMITSAYVKRVAGTGTISMTQDGGATWTDITSQLNSASYALVSVPSATITNPSVGLKIATSGDSIAVDFYQTEPGLKGPTCPMPCTTATVLRDTEEPYFGIVGPNSNDGYRLIKTILVSGKPYSGVIVYSGNPDAVGATGWLISSDAGIALNGGADGSTFNTILNVTTLNSANTGNAGLSALNKVAFRAAGGNSAVCLNAGALATGGSGIIPISTGTTHLGVTNNGSTANSLDGYISRLTFWDQELADGQLLEFTR